MFRRTALILTVFLLTMISVSAIDLYIPILGDTTSEQKILKDGIEHSIKITGVNGQICTILFDGKSFSLDVSISGPNNAPQGRFLTYNGLDIEAVRADSDRTAGDYCSFEIEQSIKGDWKGQLGTALYLTPIKNPSQINGGLTLIIFKDYSAPGRIYLQDVTPQADACILNVDDTQVTINKGETKTVNKIGIKVNDAVYAQDHSECMLEIENNKFTLWQGITTQGTIPPPPGQAQPQCEGKSDLAITDVQQYDHGVYQGSLLIKVKNVGSGNVCTENLTPNEGNIVRRDECAKLLTAYYTDEKGDHEINQGHLSFPDSTFKAGEEQVAVFNVWGELNYGFFHKEAQGLDLRSYPIKFKLDPNNCVINDDNKANNEATFNFVNKCNFNKICETDKGEDLYSCSDCGCGATKFDNVKIPMTFNSGQDQQTLGVASGFSLGPGQQQVNFKGEYDLTVNLDRTTNTVVFDVNGKKSGNLKPKDIVSLSGLNIFITSVGPSPQINRGFKDNLWDASFCISESKAAVEQAQCTGCWDQASKSCLPVGKRIRNQYCDVSKEITQQKAVDISCTEHYECLSNLCDAQRNVCLTPSVWASFLNWLKGIFG